MSLSSGLATSPRDTVAVWCLWAAVVSGIDAVAFAASTTHFSDGYRFAFDLAPTPLVWVTFFGVASILGATAGVLLLARRPLPVLALAVGVGTWSAVMFIFGISLLVSAGAAGVTGATKWVSCSVSGIVAIATIVHNEQLPRRIGTVLGILDEDFEITPRAQ